MGMRKHYYFALARLPRLGQEQLARLKRVGVVPTFEKDCTPVPDRPADLALRFDAATGAEARALLVRALGLTPRIISPMARGPLPQNTDGFTPAS